MNPIPYTLDPEPAHVSPPQRWLSHETEAWSGWYSRFQARVEFCFKPRRISPH